MTYSRRSSTSLRAHFDAEEWASGFVEGFRTISPCNLDSVRFRKAVALNGTHIAVIYDDTFGRLTGRVFSVQSLNETTPSDRRASVAAVGMILGEIVEPSAPGIAWELDLLTDLNAEFPALLWAGIDRDHPRLP